jgi:dihydrofolate reductase
MRRTGRLAALGVLLAMTLAACAGERAGQPPAAVRSTHQVQAIAENMLAAYNLDDYQAFSRDLSLPAKLIVDKHTFAEFRTENLPVTGPFVVVTSVQPEPAEQDPNHMRYRVQAQFQHLKAVALVITMSPDGQVAGLELYPRAEW